MNNTPTNVLPKSFISMASDKGLTLDQILFKLSLEHDEQTVKDLMRGFCLQTTSDEISKKGMEYLYINGFYDELQLLINKNKESNNASNRKWASVYQLSADRIQNKYTPQKKSHQEILQQANSYKTDEPELICLIEFIKIGVYNRLSEFGRIGNFLAKQQYLFDNIEDQFLVYSFKIRLYQNLFVYHWVRNELIMARKYAFRVLNLSTNVNTISNIHINLGLTYTFDTYFQGMHHLSEALKLAKKHHLRRNIKRIERNNIPFLSAHFKKVDGIYTTDPSEQAHIEIAKENLGAAREILDGIAIDSPFKLYYLGMAKQDKDILLKSYNTFIEKRSDYFFSRLPLNILKNM